MEGEVGVGVGVEVEVNPLLYERGLLACSCLSEAFVVMLFAG